MRHTYRGSCHCGEVRFAATFDLDAGTGRCNCSLCARTRFWGAQVRPQDFRLLAGAAHLTDYRFAGGAFCHPFCTRCGVRPFAYGDVPEIGGAFYWVNVTCIDNVDDATLATAPVRHTDGRHDDWDQAPAITAHL